MGSILACHAPTLRLLVEAVDDEGVDQGEGGSIVVSATVVQSLGGGRLSLGGSARMGSLSGPSQQPTQPRKRDSRYRAIHSYFLNVTHQPTRTLTAPFLEGHSNVGVEGGQKIEGKQACELQRAAFQTVF